MNTLTIEIEVVNDIFCDDEGETDIEIMLPELTRILREYAAGLEHGQSITKPLNDIKIS